jgi:hypothetical protein
VILDPALVVPEQEFVEQESIRDRDRSIELGQA